MHKKTLKFSFCLIGLLVLTACPPKRNTVSSTTSVESPFDHYCVATALHHHVDGVYDIRYSYAETRNIIHQYRYAADDIPLGKEDPSIAERLSLMKKINAAIAQSCGIDNMDELTNISDVPV